MMDEKQCIELIKKARGYTEEQLDEWYHKLSNFEFETIEDAIRYLDNMGNK